MLARQHSLNCTQVPRELREAHSQARDDRAISPSGGKVCYHTNAWWCDRPFKTGEWLLGTELEKSEKVLDFQNV